MLSNQNKIKLHPKLYSISFRLDFLKKTLMTIQFMNGNTANDVHKNANKLPSALLWIKNYPIFVFSQKIYSQLNLKN